MILKLEDQVCSIESAKRLKELGVKQESLFYWVNWGKVQLWQCRYKEYIDKYWDEVVDKGYETISAYTASELFKMLPISIKNDALGIDRFHDQWLVFYGVGDDQCFYNSLAEAAAQALIIHLISNGLSENSKAIGGG